ncbi:MAG: hypothetical protein IIA63_07810 [Nitrospinae bacterium]|nr:hypothetical protein [Nitrospinota bacterium]
MPTPKDTLPDYIRHRFSRTQFIFEPAPKIADNLIMNLLKSLKGEFIRKHRISANDLITIGSDDWSPKEKWDREKRGRIFDCILDVSYSYDSFGTAAHIIGFFLNNPPGWRQAGLFKKQVSFLLNNGDQHTKALLVGTVALGLLRTNKSLNEDIRKRSEDAGPDRFNRWLDIRESEDELHELLSVVVENIEKERNCTSKSITDLEDDSGGAE